jgi:hypothetical protein
MRDRLRRGLARQLGGPEGLPGRLVVRQLNRRNRPSVTAAVEAAALSAGEVAADVGFGGGVGLPMLLDAVGPAGHVHGVEMSRTALTRAERLHRDAIDGDPDVMAAVPVTAHGFRLRPVEEVTERMTAAGLDVRRGRLEHGPWVFHLLVGTRLAR